MTYGGGVGISRVGRSHARTGASIDEDGVGGALLAAECHPMPHGLELPYDVGGHTLLLDLDHVRQPLMVNACRVHRLLDVHVEVDDIRHDLENSVDDRAATRAAD